MEEQLSTPPARLDTKQEIARALRAFNPLERLVFMIILGIGAITVIILLSRINQHFMVSVPIEGGTLEEGVVGTPRFVNPLLAVSDADRDLTALVYRGLMKKNAAGELVPDIATSYTVSSDGLTYTFTLGDAEFQDGTPITSADVVFTIHSAEDPTLKSAERVAWEGVLVDAPDAKTVTFKLKQPFAPFLASTTLGILPKHIWEKISPDAWAYSDRNTKNSVGSGPYMIADVSTNSSGVPTYYELTRVETEDANGPLIESIRVHFYSSEDALMAAYKSGDIDVLGGIDPENAERLKEGGAQVLTSSLPRVFGLFFNPSQAKIFTDSSVRDAISLIIDKQAVVSQVLDGYGEIATGPIPSGAQLTGENTVTDTATNPEAAAKLLEKAGWKIGSDGFYEKVISKKETQRLAFEISTNDTPELTEAVDIIVEELRAAHIDASAKVYQTGSLNQDIIRPRKFQALFFGEVVTNQSDLYAFWHSSQRNDPGLNIASYTNSKADKLLEQGLATLDHEKEASIYTQLAKEISNDVPAVFVYSPSYIYVVRPELTGISLGHIDTPEDRFSAIDTWYLATDRVWKVFAKKNSL